MEGSEWRSNIISQLQIRNKNETAAFQDLIAYQSRLFDALLKNEKLSLSTERLRFSNPENVLPGGNAFTEKIQALEQKILAQQEELTSLHRRRGENAQQIINLNAKTNELEKQLQTKDETIAENTALIVSLRAEILMYETKITKLQELNQVIRDEHQALQIAFEALEDKLRKVQDENRSLVERLMKYKTKDADKMNEENEHFVKKKNDKIRKDLEDAARESSSRSSFSGASTEEKSTDALQYFSTAIPTKVKNKFIAHEGMIDAVTWSPTCGIFATGGADKKVKLWDVSKLGVTDSPIELIGCTQGVTSVDFDSTGRYIVAASNDHASRVWAINEQQLKTTLTGHTNKVMAAKFFGDFNKIITGSFDRTLKIFDLITKTNTETKYAGSFCHDLVTSGNAGSTIISGHSDKTIRFWDIRTDVPINQKNVQGKVTSLDLSRDANYLLVCTRDDTMLQLIDLRKTTELHTYSHESLRVYSETRAAFGQFGRLIAVGGRDEVIYIWNTQTGKLEATLKDHMAAFKAVSWHPESSVLASVDQSSYAVIWGDS